MDFGEVVGVVEVVGLSVAEHVVGPDEELGFAGFEVEHCVVVEPFGCGASEYECGVGDAVYVACFRTAVCVDDVAHVARLFVFGITRGEVANLLIDRHFGVVA